MQSNPYLVSVLCAVVVGGLAAGCDKGRSSTAKETPTAMAGLPPGGLSPAGATARRGSAMAPPTGAPAAGGMTGTVAETMKAGGYTYARVTVAGQDVWAAGPEAVLAVGSTVDLAGGTLMTAFRSDTLDRTFDQIYFVSDWGGGAAGAGAPHGATGGGAPHGQAVAPTVSPAEPIEPIDGSLPVAQIFADRAALAGKPVAVHGRVVKFNGGIMGKNWLHLQDGTGVAGTNDLIVTTQASAAVGEVILARGTLTLDKDLGAGYRYDVLLEDASLTAK
jgi:hypothetical protein